MREEWDRRAREDAEAYIYTRSGPNDVSDFTRSGEANYNQLVRPYLPVLLPGKNVRECRIVEIGCGIGRMTEWFAREFGFVEATDVSPSMIEGARNRLRHLPNIVFHQTNGSDLTGISTGSVDLVFSYIVFQHIPARDVIESYVREAARVLKPGGAFKFQLNGVQTPGDRKRHRDTWMGESFSQPQAESMLSAAGFSVLSQEGVGTQYYIITATKGGGARERSYVLPGEPWADDLLLNGFGSAVDASWRPLAANARVRVPGPGSTLYAGIYFWPESCHHRLTIASHAFEVATPGDHYFECSGTSGDIEITLEPPPTKAPAFRIIGLR
jgi:hypothetical protein